MTPPVQNPLGDSPQLPRQMFVALVGMLLGAGVLLVYSASFTARPSDIEQVHLARHLVYLVTAGALGWATGVLPARHWRSLAPWMFAGLLGLLLLVLVPGVGVRVNGAQRWLRAGGVSFQPSELSKVVLPIFMGWLIERQRSDAERSALLEMLWTLLPIGIVAALILPEPDLGTTVFVVFGGALTLFLSGWPLWRFGAGALFALPILLGAFALRPYQLDRVDGFLAGWRNFEDAPYQVRQSISTLGAGGLRGVGLGSGWQKLSFLPEANTDFVFAVLGEELGLVGALSVLSIWAALFLAGLSMLRRLPRGSFEFVVGAVLLTQLVLQGLINAGVVTALLPPKGIPHPFLSAGGSSLLSSLLSVGVFMSLTRGPATTAAIASTNLTDSHAPGSRAPCPRDDGGTAWEQTATRSTTMPAAAFWPPAELGMPPVEAETTVEIETGLGLVPGGNSASA